MSEQDKVVMIDEPSLRGEVVEIFENLARVNWGEFQSVLHIDLIQPEKDNGLAISRD